MPYKRDENGRLTEVESKQLHVQSTPNLTAVEHVLIDVLVGLGADRNAYTDAGLSYEQLIGEIYKVHRHDVEAAKEAGYREAGVDISNMVRSALDDLGW